MKTITIKGKSALVEHGGQRAIVPASEAGNPEALARGVPYGLPWEEVIASVGLNATPQSLAGELRKRGIWTADDLRRNVNAALGAIQAVYGLDLAALIGAANRFEGGKNG
jgi:hypothetical protein